MHACLRIPFESTKYGKQVLNIHGQWLVASPLGETSHWPTARSSSAHLRPQWPGWGCTHGPWWENYHLPHPENMVDTMAIW